MTINDVEFSNNSTIHNGSSFITIQCNDYGTDREQSMKFEFSNTNQLELWLTV